MKLDNQSSRTSVPKKPSNQQEAVKSSSTDTAWIRTNDTLFESADKNIQVIILSEQKPTEEKEWFESSAMTSFIFPMLVAVIVAWLTYRINYRKTRSEINRIEEETKQLKRSFEPHALGILVDIQKKVRDTKIEGLRELVNLSHSYFEFDNTYHEGESFIEDEYDYFVNIFLQSGDTGYRNFQKFLLDYQYVYPKKVRKRLNKAGSLIGKLYEEYKMEISEEKPLDISDTAIRHMKELTREFRKAIKEIRRDLHLDDTYLHKFIKKNKS